MLEKKESFILLNGNGIGKFQIKGELSRVSLVVVHFACDQDTKQVTLHTEDTIKQILHAKAVQGGGLLHTDSQRLNERSKHFG